MNYEVSIAVLNEQIETHQEEIRNLRSKVHLLVNDNVIFSERLNTFHDNMMSIMKTAEKFSKDMDSLQTLILSNEAKKEAIWNLVNKSRKFFKSLLFGAITIFVVLYFALHSKDIPEFLHHFTQK